MRANYERQINDDGTEVELISYYEDYRHNPPDYYSVIEKVKEALKGSGISKLSIIFYGQEELDEQE